MPAMIGDKFTFTPVPSWVENFNDSTKDADSRTRICSTFVLLPELEDSVRLVLDRIYRRQGRGFLVTGLYGSGKTIFMAYLSALLTEQVPRKNLLDTKPEWGLDQIVQRKYLTINFTAIEDQDATLEEALWSAVTRTLRSLTPPLTETLSNTDAFLDAVASLKAGTRRDIEEWLTDNGSPSFAQLSSYDKPYQKSTLEKALLELGIQLDEKKTTIGEKVQRLIEIARTRGYDGVAVFIDELYLHLIQSDNHFNRGTAFLSQLAEAGLGEDRPFWVFGAVQEEIQAIARQAGRNYDTELMGKLAGQAGRFQAINLPVTQFHRIYNHRLFKANTKHVNQLADCFRQQIQPHYRGSFADFFRRYFGDKQSVTDEAAHYAELYPLHPLALRCLTRITNRAGRSRGALGFVQEFIERYKDQRPWQQIAVLDDVFGYEDLRNKIIQDDPEIAKYYALFERFCSQARDQVVSRAPYRQWPDDEKEFVKQAAERLIKSLIVLAMVKEELDVSKLNDALLLRWPGKESDPAGSDQETQKLLEKIATVFSALRCKGQAENLTFFLSVEGDGGEREELQHEIERVINGFNQDLHREPAYRAHLELFLNFPGSPLGGTVAPQHGFSTDVAVQWQRTQRSLDYRLEQPAAMTKDHAVSTFIREVPPVKALHLLILFPSGTPLDVEMDSVKKANSRTLAWLPQTLQAQDIDQIRRSMALVKLYGDYMAVVGGGGATPSVRRKLDLLREWLGIPAGADASQPSKEAIRALCDAFVNGRILRWDAKDDAWATLREPAKVLAEFNSIPQDERSLRALIQRVVTGALDLSFPLHPDFQTAYSFSADLSAQMRRRVLDAAWKGRVTDVDPTAKADLEKYLAPLGLLDGSRRGEVAITLGAVSAEAFRKIRDRLRDRIRKASSDPKELHVAAVREDLKTSDLGLTDVWVEIALTSLISLGEFIGLTDDGRAVTQEDKSVGSPVEWLSRLTKLRAGSKPDDHLWRDLVHSMENLGRWNEGHAYSPAAAERLLDALHGAEAEAHETLTDSQQVLQLWPGAPVPAAITEQADLFRLPQGQKASQTACFTAVRDALQDLAGLPSDERMDDPNRYTPVANWAQTLQEANDFLQRIRELQPVRERLGQLDGFALPAALATARTKLLGEIEQYVITTGRQGNIADLKAKWSDFQDDYRSQYVSEHTGLHQTLKQLREQVLASPAYMLLTNLSLVEGLSAHYCPAQIERELTDQLADVGVKAICDRSGTDLHKDVDASWICSACGYRMGTTVALDAAAMMSTVATGIGEYLQHIRGCSAEIQDYVVDHPEATVLLELLRDPLSPAAETAVADSAVRSHLAQAIADARAERISVDELLEQVKPEILGFFRNGAADLKTRIGAAVDAYSSKRKPEAGRAWKVE